MRAIITADLRSAAPAWLAVLIAFVATSFAVVLPSLALERIPAILASDEIDSSEPYLAELLWISPSWNLGLTLLAGLSIIGAVTGLVVSSRRGALARLALMGATPGQVSRIVLTQVAAVAVAGAVIGTVIAVAVFPSAMVAVYADQVEIPAVGLRPSLPIAALAAAFFVLWAVLAGVKQSRVAAAVPPVEALRTIPGADIRRLSIGRWIGAILLALVVAGSAIGLASAARDLAPEDSAIVMQTSVLCLLLTGTVLSLSAPLTIGLLTRAWTALVPSRSAAWVIARSSVIAKGERLARTVTPVMFAIGILVGLAAVAATQNQMFVAMGMNVELSGTSISSMLGMLGLVLLVAIAGGVSVVLMMAKQREAELALARAVGATTDQQVLVTVFEGVIITVTGTLLGLAMMAVGGAVFAAGYSAMGFPATFVMPWGMLGAVALFYGAVIVAATTLPVLASLRRPVRVVIGSLAAE